MARSMTGYARAHTETPEFSLTLSVKSVNHRFLDVQLRLPPELDAYEVAARQLIKKKVARGSLQVNAILETRAPVSIQVNKNLVQGYLAAYRELAREHGIADGPDLNAILRLPAIIAGGAEAGSQNQNVQKALLALLDRVLEDLIRCREQEAAGIVEEMDRRSEEIQRCLQEIERVSKGLTQVLAERLGERLSELLRNIPLDSQRLLQEAALLADRSDTSEEIQRLRAHNLQLRSLIGSTGEVGKRLDFLLQEMNREANTIVSKTAGIGEAGLAITDLGLALKAEIEKIREQGMNLE